MAAKCSSGVENGANVAVVMVPLPAQGHLNQLLHLSRLISSHHIPVHYVGTSTHIRQATTRVHGWDPLAAENIHFHELPTPQQQHQSPPPVPDADAAPNFPYQLMPAFLATEHLRQPLIDLLREIGVSKTRVVVIADAFMGSVVQDVPSAVQNAEVYRFRFLSAFCIYSFLWEATGKPVVGPETEVLMNFLPSMEGCFPPEFGKFIRAQSASWDAACSGDILNSSREIEAPFLDLLGRVSKGLLQWAVGPLNPISLGDAAACPRKRHESLEWLDRQGKDSVLFVSFGSTTSLSEEQITELAIGLEQSMQKFIWVLREGDRVDVFDGGDSGRGMLPEGYEERVRGRGVVVRDWAPQLEILGHPATGGFVSHCGWNSCMESISMGVPVAAWPMHSDQPRNATLLTQVLGIGFSLVDWARRREVVGREEVAKGVRKLMASGEGGEMRKRAVALSERVKESITAGGGRKEFESFIAHITR
ncbi:unnamed protein product [Cuscuta campestris]|uniref:Glycosyltransferase n=1 Tax=Cuscuta campestris TaxID=132261 RepID=A0A484MSQ2_9ASTE|nr:unnamed protein product [Cuscuta campestris]